MLRVLVPLGIGGVFLAALSSRKDHSGPDGAIVDRRDQAYLPEWARSHVSHRNTRPWALVLHQMGFSRGDRQDAYDGVVSHYKILPNGTIVWSWDDDVRLPASQGFNAGSWAVEFAGNLPSRARSDDPRHYYMPEKFGMDQLTNAQIQAGRYLIDHLVDEGLTTILAHRQSGKERQNDPGPDIWYHVAEWAISQHGLDDGGPGFYVNNGNPIPDHWRQGAVAV